MFRPSLTQTALGYSAIVFVLKSLCGISHCPPQPIVLHDFVGPALASFDNVNKLVMYLLHQNSVFDALNRGWIVHAAVAVCLTA